MATDFDGLRFVIARYGEDVAWVPPLVNGFPGAQCTVYNKGSTGVPESSAYRVETIPNVGRESHTYLHHIIENYEEKRDEIIVFLQAHPFDHCKGTDFAESVTNGVTRILEGSMFENIGSQVIQIVDGEPMFHMSIKEELSKTYLELFGDDLPKLFTFSAGALFVTCSSSISKRPIGFYKKAVRMLETEVNPVRGFCFERLWSLFFK